MERVDDTDSCIRYNPENAWFLGGVPNEYNGTTHRSRSSSAEMFFQFNGTSITVYGTITYHLEFPSSVDEFILDDSPPKWFAPTLDGVAHQHQVMFSSAPLEDGYHTLVMKRMVDNSESWIDYIDFTSSVVGENNPPLSLPLSPLPSSTSSLSSYWTTSSLPSLTANLPQSNNNSGAQLESLSTGMLIAIVVVCMTLLITILILVFLFLRRWHAPVESDILKPSGVSFPDPLLTSQSLIQSLKQMSLLNHFNP
ncbi:hypothetical protein Moror_3678 [Moniliophthora roreri MCA 2997]|uniref:Uncharacterized protein n=1 Tax=Moniliophthora roreri (strain MCA 2997) TaxID=1381753 RepID=V2XT17_MONRO|nr:hypothetical protein Moror_3678 [Moniliophthora roreri MCA 2997]